MLDSFRVQILLLAACLLWWPWAWTLLMNVDIGGASALERPSGVMLKLPVKSKKICAGSTLR